MPKETIDYSNTIIYKIYCKDETIKDLYVGHTTNFQQRKYSHKISCNNNKTDIKIYNVIRENGGWENWDMIEIAKYNCKNSTEARIKEHEHYNTLKASLNSCQPFVDKSKYFCGICNLQCENFRTYQTHIKCNLHMKKTYQNDDKPPEKYSCEICDFNTSNLKDYKKHLATNKHINRTNLNVLEQKNPENTHEYICKKCKKCYKARNSLWYHEQKCNVKQENEFKEIIPDKDLIIMLIKQNAQLMEQNNGLMEMFKNGTINTNSHNITNSNNKAFNLNFFLNETCKNAMNITDFIDSIKLQLTDFINVGEVGFIEGISNIIVKKLNSLDETVRPIHCTDQKRETFYLKDKNIWEKDDDEKKKMKNMIRSISYKNEKLMKVYKETYPDYNDPDSHRSDQYSKIMIEAMDCKEESREKIIKNISKATIITQKS